MAQEHTQDLVMVHEEEDQIVWLVDSAHKDWKANLLIFCKKHLYEEFLF